MSNPVDLSGSCLCGNIRYEGQAEIVRAINCHCLDCQHATGGAFASMVFVEKNALAIDGETASFEHSSDRGSTMTKHFCSTCGSPMFSENNTRVGMIGIRVGTLNDTSVFNPTANIFCDSAMPVTAMDPSLERHDRMG
ncbi:MAG: GFA family protein [Pseudomonadota bacterium]